MNDIDRLLNPKKLPKNTQQCDKELLKQAHLKRKDHPFCAAKQIAPEKGQLLLSKLLLVSLVWLWGAFVRFIDSRIGQRINKPEIEHIIYIFKRKRRQLQLFQTIERNSSAKKGIHD